VLRYALVRGALLIAGLLVSSALIFLTLRVFPGDVAQLIAGTQASPAEVEALRESLGLNQPLLAQYADWIGGILRGDLGTSLLSGASVGEELLLKAQVTVPLGIMSLVIAVLIAVPFGILAALRRGHRDGTALSVGAQALAAVPVVWAGMMLIVVFSVWLGWLPPQGFPRTGWSTPGRAIEALLLPALTIGIVEGAMLMQRDPAGRRTGLRPHRGRQGSDEDPRPHPARHPGGRALHHHGPRPPGRRDHRRLGRDRAAVHASGHRPHARDRRRHPRPRQGAERAARADRLRAGGRFPRGSAAPGDRPSTAGGRMSARWFPRLWRTSTGRFGLIVIAIVALAAVVSLFWTPFDPRASNIGDRWLPPGWPHLLGTDDTGRDILSLLMAGARTTVFVSVGAGLVATVVGIALAALGALTTRLVRETVAVFVDILIAFPVLLIAMMISSVWGGSLWVVIWAVGIGFGVNIARVTWPELRRVQQSDFVLAARASGLTPAQSLVRHLLPNVAPVFIVQLSWSMAVAVLAEAGLSYLGFGASVVEPSWGLLLADLQRYIGVHPLTVIWPGLTITLTVLALNLLGDGLREATDPTLRHRAAETHTPAVVA